MKFVNFSTHIQIYSILKEKKCPFITKETFTLDKGKKKKTNNPKAFSLPCSSKFIDIYYKLVCLYINKYSLSHTPTQNHKGFERKLNSTK